MPSNAITSSGLQRLIAQLAPILVVCAIVFALPVLLNNDFLLNKVARYLVLGILTISLGLSWGFGGILNLGQAMSFGLGSYAMAMALKLKTILCTPEPVACRTSWSGTTLRICRGSGSRSAR